MDLLQLLTNKDKLDYSENYNYDNNFIGTRLFPQEKTNNLKVSIARLVENGSVPVMAQFHALDSEARIGDRTNYKEIEVEKLLIKEKLNQGERIAYYLNGVTDNDTVRDFIFDDANNLVSRVLTRAELANMQLMGYGRLEVNENNFKAVIDYGMPETNKLAVTGWSNAEHDIIGDLNKIKAQAKTKGKTIDKALTSSKVLGDMLKNTSIVNYLAKLNLIASETTLLDMLQSVFGIAFEVNDDVYKENANSKEVKRFYPEDKISFFGGTQSFGKGLYTNTPSELFGEVESSKGYVVINMWKSQDPAGIWTKAEAVYIPVPRDIEGLFIVTVGA